MNLLSRQVKFGIGIASFAALFTLTIATVSVFAADPLSDEQSQRIKANCQTIKSTLNQLHVSDALLRVNRGQFYESLAGKLMDRFNSRLEANDFDAKSVTTITASYRVALNTFRTNYQVYEQRLSDAIDVDCTKDPQGFHDAIEDARTKRTAVRDSVTQLNQYVSDYQAAVDAFAESYSQLSSGASE
jgi:hypothetical protein